MLKIDITRLALLAAKADELRITPGTANLAGMLSEVDTAALAGLDMDLISRRVSGR